MEANAKLLHSELVSDFGLRQNAYVQLTRIYKLFDQYRSAKIRITVRINDQRYLSSATCEVFSRAGTGWNELATTHNKKLLSPTVMELQMSSDLEDELMDDLEHLLNLAQTILFA